jgi:hypothetical protein
MSYDYSASHNKHSKVQHQSYLYNPHEPRDDVSIDTPLLHETRLTEDSHAMRRRFRFIAQGLRDNN